MRQVDFIAHRQDGAASNFGVLHELRVKLDMFNGKACDRIDATQTARPCVDIENTRHQTRGNPVLTALPKRRITPAFCGQYRGFTTSVCPTLLTVAEFSGTSATAIPRTC